jgi:hypothetical protein
VARGVAAMVCEREGKFGGERGRRRPSGNAAKGCEPHEGGKVEEARKSVRPERVEEEEGGGESASKPVGFES